MNRRTFMAMLAAGGIVVGGEIWMPGTKLISIPKGRSENFYIDVVEPIWEKYAHDLYESGVMSDLAAYGTSMYQVMPWNSMIAREELMIRNMNHLVSNF